MKIDKTNYSDYYFYNDKHIGFITIISSIFFNDKYVFCPLSSKDKFYIKKLLEFKTLEEIVSCLKTMNYNVISKRDYLCLEKHIINKGEN